MAEEEAGSESEEDLWAAAAEDLEQQRQILREEGDESGQEKDEGDSVAVAKEGGAAGPLADKKLDMILDIPLNLSVELGKTKMLINDLLQLGQGSVIELTKMVGEPLEVLVNKKLIAKGEVVVVNEKFGVRLTEVLGPKERIESLG
jgi:flagellar motor switch protein FliN/FliY